MEGVKTRRRVTVTVPEELLDEAQAASGSGITQTVVEGLQKLIAREAYARVRAMKGTVQLSRTAKQLREDGI